jgi:cyclopropane fatty-acyl-phospholipid synthase-like methyltransferase
MPTIPTVQGAIWNQQEIHWPGSFYQGLPVHADDEDVHVLALDVMQKHVPPQARILDVGAGAGAFSRRLLDHGYHNVQAVEWRADSFAVPGVPVYPLDLNQSWSESLPGRYDAVVSLEVIEHLENPWHFARQCAAAVHPGGWVLISTPNIESSRSRLEFLLTGQFRFFRECDYADCGHISSLTSRQMTWLGQRAGLELVEYRHNRHKGVPRPGNVRKGLRALLYLLSFPFMHGRKWGEESLFLFTRSSR